MVRFGVCSCGGFIERTVLPNIAAVGNAEVVAAYNRSEDRLQRVCDKFGIERRYTQYNDLLKQDDVDAVYIASPNVYHKSHTIMAAEAGKHVFCEKPMAMNARECQQMVDACRHHGVKLGVGFCFPFYGSQQRVKQLVVEGAIGQVSHVHISFNLGTYNKETVGWRCDPKVSGGGPLMDLGPHLVNLACFFLDDQVKKAMAYVHPDKTNDQIELDAVVALEFERGGRATFETSFVRGNVPYYSVVGSGGEIHAVNTTCQTDGGELRLITHEKHETINFEKQQGIAEQIHLFCRAIEQGSEPAMSGETGLHVQAVIDGIYESGRSGRRQSIEA